MWLCPVSGPVNAKVMILCHTSCSNGGDDPLKKSNSGMHYDVVHAAIVFKP